MKKIEKLKTIDDEFGNPDIYCIRDTVNQLIENQNQLDDKLNEIIDRLESEDIYITDEMIDNAFKRLKETK